MAIKRFSRYFQICRKMEKAGERGPTREQRIQEENPVEDNKFTGKVSSLLIKGPSLSLAKDIE
jgi:hypothetical protein